MFHSERHLEKSIKFMLTVFLVVCVCACVCVFFKDPSDENGQACCLLQCKLQATALIQDGSCDILSGRQFNFRRVVKIDVRAYV